MKKLLKWILAIIVLIYLLICGWFYLGQEQLLFKTVKQKQDHVFKFEYPFEEKYIPVKDNKKLHGVLFKAKESKGLILWLPGGRGMIDSIGLNAPSYTNLDYDLFVINYRGFGKSEGKITSEGQFTNDMQAVYDFLKKEYKENNIVVFGYSLGTGPAAALAAANNPKKLILRAPYYSMNEEAAGLFYYIPTTLLLKYKFSTYEHLKKVQCPVVIFHGDADKKIAVEKSNRLKEYLKPTDELIVLKGQEHNNFEKNSEYMQELSRVLK